MSRREPRLTKRARKTPPPGGKLRASSREITETPGELTTVPGMRTMSDVLTEWAAPILEPWRNEPIEILQNALTFASLIWNVATASEGSPPGAVDEIFERMEAIGIPAPESLRHVIEALVESRRADYAHDMRIVILPRAIDASDGRRIQVEFDTVAARTWPR